jgi:hypothetical protein
VAAAVAALSGEAMRAFYRETLLGAEHGGRRRGRRGAFRELGLCLEYPRLYSWAAPCVTSTMGVVWLPRACYQVWRQQMAVQRMAMTASPSPRRAAAQAQHRDLREGAGDRTVMGDGPTIATTSFFAANLSQDSS